MVRRILVSAATLVALTGSVAPAFGADTPERHLVFIVHDDQTTRTRTRQETDIHVAYGGTGALNVGAGGGVNDGIQGAAIDTKVTVDVMLVTPEGVLGCNVKLADDAPARRIWIGRDGTVRAEDKADVDPSIAFLLSMLATRVLPVDARAGVTWRLGKVQFKVAYVQAPVARLEVQGEWGALARGTSEEGWADYVPSRFVLTDASLSIVQTNQTPTQEFTRRRRVSIRLESDSLAPRGAASETPGRAQPPGQR